MKLSIWGATIAALTALSVAACDGSADSSAGSPAPSIDCHRYDSCSTCTPVPGCGWCYTANGAGQCASDPDECAGSAEFLWTWNPTGCHVAADADVVPQDANVDVAPQDATVDVVSLDAPEDVIPTDASSDAAPPDSTSHWDGGDP